LRGRADDLPYLYAPVMPGVDVLVEFTPQEAGTYAFYCTAPGHNEAGMQGTLVAREPQPAGLRARRQGTTSNGVVSFTVCPS
jgi:heme/copper-type cytochrome/quinol oxidase subunit 2